MSEQQKCEFVADLRDPGGLPERVSAFVRHVRASTLLHDRLAEGPAPCPGLVEHIVGNHLQYLAGRGHGEHGTFFRECLRLLDDCGANAFTAAEWCELTSTLVSRMAAAITEAAFGHFYRALHDVHKAACDHAYERLNAPDVPPDEEARIAEAMADLLRSFELDITRVASPFRPRTPVNVAGDLRRVLVGTLGYLPGAEVELPPEAWILAWAGARTDEITPLLGAVRSNVANALRGLPPEAQRYRCIVERVDDAEGARIRVTVENAFNRQAPPNPFSTGVGLTSIRRRALALDGAVETEVDEAADPPLYRLRLYLPAAEGRA